MKYKKGKNAWLNANHEMFNNNKEYEPETIKERVFNEKTEQYEYIVTEVNHKLNWEQTEQQLMDLMEIEKIERNNK